ncbi:insulinase family protein [Phormidium sp. FACHB-592]|uniref:Insulinase family protein n=1 Tax=Stenomitos frigidus AS-A4 TaxID=2933935 RepID=A0ABV0KNP2_9CYAN|nr:MULTISPECIES: pitrilysin family protein [Cyanophyceae]MBD2038649.1 insulinase family protein [Leptolyngbya sp. FACHB-321]MBD2077335.1 insulinase family protein [Phormidium sp. FACHB-592]
MTADAKKQKVAKTITLVFSFVLVPLILLFMAFRPAVAETPKHYTDLTFAPPPELKLPDYTRFKLANGMVVYLVEDHELPLINGTALIRTGDRLEPSDKVGLAELVGTVMRSGGTQKHTADAINEFLEQRAASVETGIGDDAGSAGFDTLTEDLPEVFALFAETLRQPAFPDDKLNLAKTQQRGGIARRNDDPDSIASREFRKLVYGDRSPYARFVEYATLANVSRDDLVSFYQQYFHPNNILLGIVGDFDTKSMRQLVETTFADWKPVTAAPPALPTVEQAKKGGVFFVNQPQLTQSNVQIGHLGGQANSPDYPALSVMNEVLNGFGGRLFNEVRSRQGLAYSVYAYWGSRYDYPGLFVAGGQTRSDATVPFIKSVQAEIQKVRTAPIAPVELAFAKDSVLNSFIFNFQQPEQTLSRLLRYEYFGYPADFIFRYQKGVAATTIADVQRVAKTYLQPDKIVTLVVGNQATIKPSLDTLGQPVTTLDITIPAPSKS